MLLAVLSSINKVSNRVFSTFRNDCALPVKCGAERSAVETHVVQVYWSIKKQIKIKTSDS